MNISTNQTTDGNRTGHPLTGLFTVGGWRVDPSADQISHDDSSIKLEPRVMELLVYLARHPGQVVSRQTLEAHVWQGRVVSYDAVTNAVIKLRRAFDDDSRNPRIIETLSKRGYRLIAPVQPVSATGLEQGLGSSATQAVNPAPKPWRWWATGAAMVFAGLIVAVLLQPDAGEVQPAARARIVVLPFDNLSGNPGQDYISRGMTQDLITELSRSPRLAVIAVNSAFAYEGNESLARLRRELDVDYVVRGSVRREAEQVRINALLLDANEGRHIWAEHYDGVPEDTFDFQDAIVGRITTSLDVNMRGGAAFDATHAKYSDSIAAYDHYLQGRDHYGRRSLADLESAKESFRKAIELDPGFARAHASLALTHLRDIIDGWTGASSASLQEARESARRATELDDALPEVHFVNALLALFERDYQLASAELDRATALRPSYADAHGALAWVLHFAGRPVEAKERLQTAMLLNPHVTAPYLLIDGGISFTLGRTEEAVATLQQALDISPTHPRIHIWLAAAHARAGRLEEANWIIEQLLVLHPSISLSRIGDAFPFKDPAALEVLVAALRDAGLPEG